MPPHGVCPMLPRLCPLPTAFQGWVWVTRPVQHATLCVCVSHCWSCSCSASGLPLPGPGPLPGRHPAWRAWWWWWCTNVATDLPPHGSPLKVSSLGGTCCRGRGGVWSGGMATPLPLGGCQAGGLPGMGWCWGWLTWCGGMCRCAVAARAWVHAPVRLWRVRGRGRAHGTGARAGGFQPGDLPGALPGDGHHGAAPGPGGPRHAPRAARPRSQAGDPAAPGAARAWQGACLGTQPPNPRRESPLPSATMPT